MSISIFQFILISLFFACVNSFSPNGYLTKAANPPLVIGYVIGLILGKPMEGAMMGATIGMVYLGQISVGNVIASNGMVGGTVGVTFALASGLSAEEALAIAVPASLLATAVSTWLQPINLLFSAAITKSFEKKNYNRARIIRVFSLLKTLAIHTTLMTLILYLGTDVVSNAVNNMPAWATTGITCVGRALPAVGIALGLSMVGSEGRIMYAIGSFIIAKQLGLSTLVLAVLAVLLAGIMIYGKKSRGELDDLIDVFKQPKVERNHILSMKDVYACSYNLIAHETWCKPVDKYAGISWMMAIFPVLKKLYPNDLDRAYEEVQKHDCYFNTSSQFAGIIAGPVCAMEEERALGNEDITAETIQAYKASTMGPVAGIGDPLGQGTLDTILKTVGISMVLGGSIAGVYVQYFGIIAWCMIALFGLTYVGYKYGGNLIAKLLDGGAMKLVTEFGGMIGCISFGALASSSITVKCGLTIAGLELQTALFDKIMTGLLPLVMLLICYNLLSKKKIGVFKLILIVFVLFFVLGAVGILGV